MTHSDDVRLLAYAADRARMHPDYLGWVLAQYSTLEHLAEPELVRLLGMTGDELARLRLCLRPRADHFAADVEQISATFNIDAGRLAQIVRFVDSVTAMASPQRRAVTPAPGLLMAARAQPELRPAPTRSRRQHRRRRDHRGPHDAASQS